MESLAEEKGEYEGVPAARVNEMSARETERGGRRRNGILYKGKVAIAVVMGAAERERNGGDTMRAIVRARVSIRRIIYLFVK